MARSSERATLGSDVVETQPAATCGWIDGIGVGHVGDRFRGCGRKRKIWEFVADCLPACLAAQGQNADSSRLLMHVPCNRCGVPLTIY